MTYINKELNFWEKGSFHFYWKFSDIWKFLKASRIEAKMILKAHCQSFRYPSDPFGKLFEIIFPKKKEKILKLYCLTLIRDSYQFLHFGKRWKYPSLMLLLEYDFAKETWHEISFRFETKNAGIFLSVKFWSPPELTCD